MLSPAFPFDVNIWEAPALTNAKISVRKHIPLHDPEIRMNDFHPIFSKHLLFKNSKPALKTRMGSY